MSILKSFILGAILLVSFNHVACASYNTKGLTPADAKAYAKIETYVLEAENKTGESADLITAVTYIESNFGRNVINPHSRVKGVMQQTPQRWNSDLSKHAKRLGLSAKSSVHNKRANILVGAAGLADNRQYLESKVKHRVTDGDVYMSWFVGLYGAEKILKGNPDTKVSKYVKISKGNWGLYTNKGKVLTVAQFRAKMIDKVKGAKQQTSYLVDRVKFNDLINNLS